MSTPFSGGCACGAIRYERTAEPAISLNCHCRDCQRASGSAFAPIRRVPTSAQPWDSMNPAITQIFPYAVVILRQREEAKTQCCPPNQSYNV